MVSRRYVASKVPAAEKRCRDETAHRYRMLSARLKGREWLGMDYSVADVATWPAVPSQDWSGIPGVEGLEHFAAGMQRMGKRPAARRE